MKKVVIPILVGLAIIAVGGIGYLMGQQANDTSAAGEQAESETAEMLRAESMTMVPLDELTEDQIALFQPTADSFRADVLLGNMTIEEMEAFHSDILDGYIAVGELPENAHALFYTWKAAIGYYEDLAQQLVEKGFLDEAQSALARVPEERPQLPVKPEEPEEAAEEVAEPIDAAPVAPEPTKPTTNTQPAAPQQSSGIIGNGFDAEGYHILSPEEIYQIYGQYTRPAIKDNWLADLIREEYSDSEYLDNLLQPKYINQLEIKYLSRGEVSGKLSVEAEDVGNTFENSYKRALESEANRIVEDHGVPYEIAYEYVVKHTEYVNAGGQAEIHKAVFFLMDQNGYDHDDDVAYTAAVRKVNLTLDQLVPKAMAQGVPYEQAYADALYQIAGIKPALQ